MDEFVVDLKDGSHVEVKAEGFEISPPGDLFFYIETADEVIYTSVFNRRQWQKVSKLE